MMQQMVIMNSRPQDAYRKQGVLTASPIELVVMLYDGLKKNLLLGKRDITKKDIMGAHKHLMKAQDIVGELINSLDMSFEISKELLNLYDFIQWSLQNANIHKSVDELEPVIEIVDSLRDAWEQVSKTNRGSMQLVLEEAQA